LLFAEGSPEAIFVSKNASFVYLNAAALRLFGASSADQLLGSPVMERIHPNDRAMVAERIRRRYEEGQANPLNEETYLRLDGSTVRVEVAAVPFIYRGENCTLNFVRDITRHKQAEAELRRNQFLLQSIIDNSTAVIFVKDLESRYLRINRRYSELFHIRNEAVLGRTDHDIFPAEVADALRAADLQVLAADAAQEFEEMVPHDDGMHTYITLKFPMRDVSGMPYGICGIATDITDRKRAEAEIKTLNETLEKRVIERTEELRAKEVRLQETLALNENVLMVSPVGIAVYRDDGQCIRANLSLAKIANSTREQLLKQNFYQLVSWQKSGMLEMAVRVLATGARAEHETLLTSTFGRTFWGRIHMARVSRMGMSHLLLMMEDITDRKQIEATLLKSDADLRAMLDNSPYLVWLKDIEGRYISINTRYADFLRLEDARQAIGKTDLDLQPKELAEKYRASDAEVMATRKQKHAEVMAFDGDKNIWMESFKTPIIDKYGNVLGTVGFASDITERKKIEIELRIAATAFEAHQGIVVTDPNNVILRTNKAFSKITGYTAEEVVGQKMSILRSDRQGEAFYAQMWKKISSDGTWDGEIWNRCKNGEVRLHWITISSVKDKNGLTTHYVGTYTDVTESKLTNDFLRTTTDRLNEAQRVAHIGSWELDLLNDKLIWSDEIFRLFEIDQNQFGATYEAFLNAVHPEDRDLVNKAYTQSLANRTPYEITHRLLMTDGRIKWVQERCTTEFDATGRPLRSLGIVQDITERIKAEEQLRIAAVAFETHQGMMITDANSVILRVNKGFTETTGYTAEEAVGQTPRLLKSGRHDADFYRVMWETIKRTGGWEGEIWDRRKNGEVYPKWLTISAVNGEDGVVTHYVGSHIDITERKYAEEEAKNLAFFDPLTKLPNRRLLLDRLQQAMASSARNGRQGALLFIDLDNFKILNDTLGHSIGDLLLQQVAKRLTSSVREGDAVARIGGDEFVVMLEDLSNQDLEAAAQTEAIGEKILHNLRQSYQLAKNEHLSTASVGAVLFNGHQQAIEDLLKQADIAMYQAKKAGRNMMRFFDPKMQETINALVILEAELRKALETHQFHLYYQIQVDSSGRRLGAETLIRWAHPERGLVFPAQFIPTAEETELILPIGQWVLETACAQLKAWEQDALTRDLILSVNVSARQFHQSDFVARVQAAVQLHAINPRLLTLELTESMLLENIEGTIANMNALNEIGVQLSLDDFGTGYSSLQYLKHLPLDQLKIAQSFVRDIAVDSNDKAIVRTIIAMAKSLNLDVIGEGVETEEQQQFLLDSGCTHYQGYLFGKPVPIEQFEASLKQG